MSQGISPQDHTTLTTHQCFPFSKGSVAASATDDVTLPHSSLQAQSAFTRCCRCGHLRMTQL
eukprot:6455593-Amphidinium_carterae.7